MASINTEKLLEGFKQYFDTPELATAIANIKADFSLKAIFALCNEAVERVEILADDLGEVAGVTGEEKLAVVKKWLDDIIELPALLEWLDNIGIDALVNSFVAWHNLKDGKHWVEKLKGAL